MVNSMVDATADAPAPKPVQWAIVEVFGHTRLAGQIFEERRWGEDMLRVDVPTTPEGPPYSRFFGGKAIFSVTLCDEATARREAARCYRPDHLTYIEQDRVARLGGPNDRGDELDVETDDDVPF